MSSRSNRKVQAIVDQVRQRGDQALMELTRKFDRSDFQAQELRVGPSDIEQAYQNTDEEIIRCIREQINLSRIFHRAQRERIVDWETESAAGICSGEKMAADWTRLDFTSLAAKILFLPCSRFLLFPPALPAANE